MECPVSFKTPLLLNQDVMEQSFQAWVAVGVGTLDLIDDRVCLTNWNRQIFATRKTVGSMWLRSISMRSVRRHCPRLQDILRTPYGGAV